MFSIAARWASRATRQMSTATITYPFSKAAIASEPVVPLTEGLKRGKGLMEHVRKTLVAPEKKHMVEVLFSRRHKDRILPGSVLTVFTQQPPFSFSGVLLSIRRRGPDTSFVLRNVVQKTGVEMQFFVNSPDVKRIEVIQHAGGRGGREGRRMRRAKLFYLRDQPDKMTAISAGIRS